MTNQGKLGAIVMSNWQHTLMAEAIEHGGISLDRMLELKQGTSGSLIKRNYFSWDDSQEMFMPTPGALKIMESFVSMDLSRKTTYRPLSSLIRDRSVHKLAEARRAELKHQADEQHQRENDQTRLAKKRKSNSKATSNGAKSKSQHRSVA